MRDPASPPSFDRLRMRERGRKCVGFGIPRRTGRDAAACGEDAMAARWMTRTVSILLCAGLAGCITNRSLTPTERIASEAVAIPAALALVPVMLPLTILFGDDGLLLDRRPRPGPALFLQGPEISTDGG